MNAQTVSGETAPPSSKDAQELSSCSKPSGLRSKTICYARSSSHSPPTELPCSSGTSFVMRRMGWNGSDAVSHWLLSLLDNLLSLVDWLVRRVGRLDVRGEWIDEEATNERKWYGDSGWRAVLQGVEEGSGRQCNHFRGALVEKKQQLSKPRGCFYFWIFV